MTMTRIFPMLFLCFTCNACFGQNTRDTVFSVYFETANAALNARQRDAIKEFLRARLHITCIEGFADTTASAQYNLGLSKRRAEAVYQFVKTRHGQINRNVIRYHGESDEFADLGENRRVQISAVVALPAPAALIVMPKGEKESIPGSRSLPSDRDTIRVITLENIYFFPDLPVLTEESLPYLQEVSQQLRNYPSAIFEIVGHINYQSRYDSTHLGDLYHLSTQRAKVVYDYLLENGIAASRMRYKGVGNSQPAIAAPRNDEERMKNMRVQIIVLGK